jgi:hypothetical protein
MRKTSANKAKGKKNRPKTKLGIPDLEHSKTAVLRSLGSPDSRRGYRHAIDEFVAWYCSEPRLAFNKTVVLRYRFHLEQRGLAPATINVRMADVRRLGYEAADSGLLSKLKRDRLGTNLASGFVRRLEVGCNYPCTPPCECQRDCLANALASPGDQGHSSIVCSY